jgi:broad specificity phosphatase PhoE
VITLYVIRHAESEANAKRLLASRLPFPLTDAGRAEAENIAAQFAGIAELDRIVSSPLLRALQTAEPFGRVFGLPVETDERLAEQDLGAFSGLTYDEVKAMDDYERDATARWDWVPRGGGESYRMIADRVRDFLRSLESRPEGERLLVVTHAVTLRLMRALLEDTLPAYPKDFPNNGEIWRLSYAGLGARHGIESIFLGNSRMYVHNP